MSKILDSIVAAKWALAPVTLAQMVTVIQRWNNGEKLDPELARQIRMNRSGGRYAGGWDDDGGSRPKDPYEVCGKVAVVNVCGLIARHAGMVNGFSQPEGIAVEDLTGNLKSAAKRFNRILLDVDSPGGTLAGMAELQACIDGLRAGGVKVVALARDQMCSGAYWMGCRCDDVFAVSTAEIGSIGVYQCVTDYSQQLAGDGVKVHLVASGPHKGAGADGTELTDVQLGGLLEGVKDAAALFTSVVKQGRGMSDEQAAAVSTGQAWMAEQAMELGLIDGIVTSREALIEEMNARA